MPNADEWYKAAYYDPINNVYYNYATGSDSLPTSVSSGTAPGTAVYGKQMSHGPADVTLAGGLSPYGTMGQNGNVFEWQEEARVPRIGQFDTYYIRGGSWEGSFDTLMQSSQRGVGNPTFDFHGVIGLRVSSIAVPEPSGLLLIGASTFVLFVRRGSICSLR